MHRVESSPKQTNKTRPRFPNTEEYASDAGNVYISQRPSFLVSLVHQFSMAFTSRCLGEGIIHIPDHCVLFCTKHQSAIPFSELKYYLRANKDHKLPPENWQPIIEAAEAIRSRLKNTVAELDIPDNDSEPLPFLPVLDSVRCLKCHYLRGTRKDDRVLKAHIEKNYSIGTNGK